MSPRQRCDEIIRLIDETLANARQQPMASTVERFSHVPIAEPTAATASHE